MITFVTFKDYTKRMKAAASRLFLSEYTTLSGSVPPCGTCNASAMLCVALNSGKGGAAFLLPPQLFKIHKMLRSSRATTVAPSPMAGHLDAARSAGVVSLVLSDRRSKKMRRKCTTSEKMITFVTSNDFTKRMKAAASRLFSSEYTTLSGSVPPCGTCNASAMLCRALDSGKGGAAFLLPSNCLTFYKMLRSSRATTVAPSPMPGHLDAARSAGVVSLVLSDRRSKKMRRKCTTSEKMITFATSNDLVKRMKAAATRLFSSEYTTLSGSVPPCGTCNASAMLYRALDSGKGGAAFLLPSNCLKLGKMLHSSRATTVAPSPMAGHLDAARSAGVVYQLRYGSYIIDEFATSSEAVRYADYLPTGLYEVRRVQCDGEFRVFDPATDYQRKFYNKATTGHDTHE